MKRLAAAAAAVTGAALLAYVLAWHTWGFLYGLGVHPYPAGSATPWTYQMWSGIIPALTVLTLFGSLGGMYHLHNCAWTSCWRLGKHKVNGTPWCDTHLSRAKQEVTDSERLDRIAALLEELAHRRAP